MFWCVRLYLGTVRLFQMVRFGLWCGNRLWGGRFKDELQERDKGKTTERARGCQSWRSNVGRWLEREAVQLRYDAGADTVQIKTRSARDRWPGKAVESQARSSAVPIVTNKGKSNVLEVITGPSNKVRQGGPEAMHEDKTDGGTRQAMQMQEGC